MKNMSFGIIIYGRDSVSVEGAKGYDFLFYGSMGVEWRLFSSAFRLVRTWIFHVISILQGRGVSSFSLYMDELPVWDGKERLEALARRVSDNPFCIKEFWRWMMAIAAQ